MKTNFKSAKEYIKLKKKEGSESLCGSGSHMSNASDVIDFIQKTIDKHNIKSILDLGCGDWNWFKEINFSKNINYIGWDCDKEMIESNEQKYGSDKIKFEEKDIVTSVFPKVDLIICRDVLFHLEEELSLKIISKTKDKCKYFISTSYLSVDKNTNIKPYIPISGWGFYQINLNINPFNLDHYQIDEQEEQRIKSNGQQRSVCLYKF